MGHAVEPVRDLVPLPDGSRLAHQHQEGGLKGVLGVLVAAQDAEADAPDHRTVPAHQGGKSGFLADVGDVDAMANYAIDILKDESALRQMGKNCRASARARFCTTKIIPQYEDFYRLILERSS